MPTTYFFDCHPHPPQPKKYQHRWVSSKLTDSSKTVKLSVISDTDIPVFVISFRSLFLFKFLLILCFIYCILCVIFAFLYVCSFYLFIVFVHVTVYTYNSQAFRLKCVIKIIFPIFKPKTYVIGTQNTVSSTRFFL